MSSRSAFRWVAMTEATSWLILIVATVVKYTTKSQTAVHVMGPIHGALFVVYVVLALALRTRFAWNARALLIVLVDSIIPGGGFLVARRRELQDHQLIR